MLSSTDQREPLLQGSTARSAWARRLLYLRILLITVLLILLIIIVDCIEGYVLSPHIMGRAVDIGPVDHFCYFMS